MKTRNKIRARFEQPVTTPHDVLHLTDRIITEGWVIQEDQVRWDEMCAWQRREDR